MRVRRARDGWLNKELKTVVFRPGLALARILPLLILGNGAQLAGDQVTRFDGHGGKFML
jgi:hypothetical protein